MAAFGLHSLIHFDKWTDLGKIRQEESAVVNVIYVASAVFM